MALKVVATDENKKFSFTADCKMLGKILSIASSVHVTGSIAKSFFILAYKKNLYVISFSSESFVCIQVPDSDAQSDGILCFPYEVLEGLIKGRSAMSFNYDGQKCAYKLVKGQYNGHFNALPLSSDDIKHINSKMATAEKAKAPEIPANTLASLKEGMAFCSIKDVFKVEQTVLICYVTLTKKGILSVSAFDQHHFGLYRNKVDPGIEFKIAMPFSHFATVDRVASGQPAVFYFSSDSVRIEGEDFTLFLPATQVEEKNYTLIPEYIKGLEEPTFVAECDVEKLRLMASNMLSIHAVNTSYSIEYKQGSGSLKFSYSTSGGSSSDSMKLTPVKDKSVTAQVDPKILVDNLNLLKVPTATVSITKERVLTLKARSKLGAQVTLVSAIVG